VFFESQKYLEFAVSVRVAFALGEFAGNRIEVREMADARTTGFEEDRVSADVADEKAMMFECEVGCDELAV